jgi:hypothetical protein
MLLSLNPALLIKAALSMPFLLLLMMARTVPVADAIVGFLAIAFFTVLALGFFCCLRFVQLFKLLYHFPCLLG